MKAKRYYKMALVAVFLLTSCVFSATTLMAGTITDSFDDNSMNTKLWQVDKNGLPTVKEVNQEVEVSIPANIQGESWAGYTSRFALRGDFDMQVDYRALSWPSNSGASIELWFGPDVAFSNRVDYINSGEVYEASFTENAPYFSVATADTSGKLRITRTGNTVTSYYWSSGAWVTIGYFTNPALAKDGTLGFSAGGWPPNFGGQSVQVAFDNFQLHYAQLVPSRAQPSLLLLLD